MGGHMSEFPTTTQGGHWDGPGWAEAYEHGKLINERDAALAAGSRLADRAVGLESRLAEIARLLHAKGIDDDCGCFECECDHRILAIAEGRDDEAA